MYSLSQSELQALGEFIDKNSYTGFIWSASSPHGAPILFVHKKDGSLWLCIDYWGLNKITKKDHYPLLLISDLLSTAGKAHIYTTLNLWHAYHLVHLAEGDEWKTAFHTCYGSFEWHVMPFGLTNAPATFQHFMNDIFKDLLNVTVIVYLDNILIFFDNPKKYCEHVHKVLWQLWQHGLYSRPDKCHFSTDAVEYLSYILFKDGLTMSPTTVQAIKTGLNPGKSRMFNLSWALQTIHCQLLWHCCSTHLHYKKRHILGFLPRSSTIIWNPQVCFHLHPYTLLLDSQLTYYCWNWCLWLGSRHFLFKMTLVKFTLSLSIHAPSPLWN